MDANITVGGLLGEIAVNPDTNTVYVTGGNPDRVSVINGRMNDAD